MKIMLLSFTLLVSSLSLTQAQVGSQANTFPEKGNVGIGVDKPREALEVAGNIQAADIKCINVNVYGLTVNDNAHVMRNFFLEGLLGIGTPTPTEKLDVVGNAKFSGSLSAASLQTGSFTGRGVARFQDNVTFDKNVSVLGQSQFTGDVRVTGNIQAGVIEATEFRWKGAETPFRLDHAILSQGLSIGTNKVAPDHYKLAVGGAIIATGLDLKIPQKWPDYVFAAGYRLPSLTSLKKYINQHGHLPNVPSAEEMNEQQHYSLAEMDAKLLEKIEELTLYIIQLEEKIQKLELNKAK